MLALALAFFCLPPRQINNSAEQLSRNIIYITNKNGLRHESSTSRYHHFRRNLHTNPGRTTTKARTRSRIGPQACYNLTWKKA